MRKSPRAHKFMVVYLSVLDTATNGAEATTARAAVRVFGTYGSMASAQEAVRAIVRAGAGQDGDGNMAAVLPTVTLRGTDTVESPTADVEAFVIEELGRWIPVRAVVRGAGLDEEEVGQAVVRTKGDAKSLGVSFLGQ